MDFFPIVADLMEPETFSIPGMYSRNSLLTHLGRPNDTACMRGPNGLIVVQFPSGSRRGTKRTKRGEEPGFKVNIDIQQFFPSDVSVKVVGKDVIVEAEHEERLDEHGFISRSFKRRYVLPEDVEVDLLTSTLSSDGVLTLFAPKKQAWPMPDKNERIVPIIQTGTTAVKQTLQTGSSQATNAPEKTGDKDTAGDKANE